MEYLFNYEPFWSRRYLETFIVCFVFRLQTIPLYIIMYVFQITYAVLVLHSDPLALWTEVFLIFSLFGLLLFCRCILLICLLGYNSQFILNLFIDELISILSEIIGFTKIEM